MKPIIQLSQVHYQAPFGQETVSILTGCDLAVSEGSSVAIVGRSGSGKSTLLSLMAGLELPSQGEVWLMGTPLMASDEDARATLRAQRVGFVFQNFQLIAGMTAFENVLLPLELFGGEDAAARARAALTYVGLEQRLHHYPSQLSGGEQQRVAIARAMVSQPKIIFADEPTGNLDEQTATQIQRLLLSLCPQTTLVVVTHDPSFARQCDYAVSLQQGQLQPMVRL